MVALAFLAPAALILLVLVCYPIANTIWLSVHSSDGRRFVGLDNYVRMFTAPETRRAIINNVVWVVAAPAIVTTLGLIFAVLTERVRRATALKVILFMPMAISFLAAGVTFRLVYDENPDRGALNAAVVAVHDTFAPPSKYYDATPREEARLVPHRRWLRDREHRGLRRSGPAAAGRPAAGADPRGRDAAALSPSANPNLRGVIWLDFTRGGGGAPGVIDATELGLPGVTVEASRTERWLARPPPTQPACSSFLGSPETATRSGWPMPTSPSRFVA